MGPGMSKLNIDYKDVSDLVVTLVEKIKESERQFDIVVGIKEGGIPVSEAISNSLDIPHTSVKISRYDGEVLRKSLIVIDSGFRVSDHNGCLIVDDLVDQGFTINAFVRHFGLRSQDAVAVLYWNKDAVYQPDFYAQEKPPQWIVFPWERKEAGAVIGS